MERNEGLIDRTARVLLGLFGIYAWYSAGSLIAGIFGVIIATTGMLGFCPLYTLVGFKTCGIKK